MNETQRRFLRRLRDAQPHGLRRSSLPRGCNDLIHALQTCGAIEFRPSQIGRGIVLCITCWEAFDMFVAGRLPRGLDVDMNAIHDRATAVAMLADAKYVSCSQGQGLLVRSTKPHMTICSPDGEISIPVGELTTQTGSAVIQLAAERNWSFSGEIAIVENADTFWQHDLVLPEVDLAILASGNMSARFVAWLASPEMSQCRIVHWGDYDPVGVWQYLRLADACPGRVATFAPPKVDELLPKFGKRSLVTRQASFLDRIRRRASDPHVRRMLGLFDRHRRGLEQEILLHSDVRAATTDSMRAPQEEYRYMKAPGC